MLVAALALAGGLWIARGRAIGGPLEAIVGCLAGACLAGALALALFGAPHPMHRPTCCTAHMQPER